MAKTIDDLGFDSSTRYASDRQIYDATLESEGRLIPSQTKVATTTPTYESEFDTMFQLKEIRIPAAAFEPPLRYNASKRNLFGPEGIIPSLGSPDHLEALAEKIKQISAPETAKINNLLEEIQSRGKDLIDIYSRRSQYQKG